MTLREQASERLSDSGFYHAVHIAEMLDVLQPLFDQVERERDLSSERFAIVTLLAERDDLRAKLTQAEADYPEAMMRCFIGWLTADIPELHAVEVPRLDDSLRRFLSKGTPVAIDRSVTP